MKKKIFSLIIFIVVFVVGVFIRNYYKDYYKESWESHVSVIDYADYDKIRDWADVDNLMEKYKFWLFHGGFETGKCPLYPNFENSTHSDDFDSANNVHYYIKVVRVDNRCVGFVTYYISENFKSKKDELKKLGRIHLLCIDENYRRLGIAKKLVEECMLFFKKQNCQRVYLITRPENIRAKALYYKFGFSEATDRSGGVVERNVFDKDPADILIKDF